MGKFERKTLVKGTASALAIFALGGAANADDMNKTDNGKNAHEYQSMDKLDKQETLKKFGVSELNDIENWKVTHGGAELGEVDRIGVDRSTGELLAVVGLKGVIGANMKEVAVPLSKLEVAGTEMLSTSLTKSELQKARDIDPWDGSFSQVIDGSKTQ
jgi:hypothetical protein